MLRVTEAQREPGRFTLGDTARVVGSVSQQGTLARLAVRAERDCDVVEVRVDLIGPTRHTRPARNRSGPRMRKPSKCAVCRWW